MTPHKNCNASAEPAPAGRQARSTPVSTPVSVEITPEHFDAVLFDLDGVLTSTAAIHAEAWKQMFDGYLKQRSARTGEPFRAFEIETDYKHYVDGRPRYDGVKQFLESRGIHLPQGTPASSPAEESVCGLGNVKNELVQRAIDEGRVQTYPASVEFVKRVLGAGIRAAVVTSSRNCVPVLRAAGIEDLFEVRVDGLSIEEHGLRGKPAPDGFLRAAEEMHVRPSRAVVVEDAISGVQAGRAGGFGLVIGIDRHGEGDALYANGADVVVNDLEELLDAVGRGKAGAIDDARRPPGSRERAEGKGESAGSEQVSRSRSVD